jgi:pyrimidine-specific ribonucleoside hydrolase
MALALNPKPILIDTDIGVDDALAIILAMRSPEIKVHAITTVAGNVEVEKCTRNVQVLLDHLRSGYRPAVIQGARRPLRLDLITAPEVHGSDGLGNTQPILPIPTRNDPNRAIACIRRLCDQFENQLTIIALGPLTNIALATMRYPASLKRIKSIVSMGGAFHVPGNTGPVAEFNYYVDPHAAQIVLDSGLPITVVPLDVTQQAVVLRNQINKIAHIRENRLVSFIAQFTRTYMLYHKRTEGFEGGYLHDPMAVAVAIRPSFARCSRAHIDIECGGTLTRGMSSMDFRKQPRKSDPKIVLEVDRLEFLRMFNQRVLTA